MQSVDLNIKHAGQAISVVVGQPDDATAGELRRKLQGNYGLVNLAGEATNATKMLSMAEQFKPDVVLIRIGFPELEHDHIVSRIKNKSPHSKVMVIIAIEEDSEILAALCAGADGYYISDVTGDQLVTAMAAVVSGSVCMHPVILQRLSDLCPFPYGVQLPDGSRCFGLSNRELQVLRLLIEGCSNREIGQRLGVSMETVKTHLRHLMKKLHVSDRTQAAVKAIKEKVMSTPNYMQAL